MSDDEIRPDEAEPAEVLASDDSRPEAADAPEADAVEQLQEVVEHASPLPTALPDDADQADAYEQSLVVEYDEDDYR
ncbi:MAG TPA: hypothetical protein VIP77_21965 [Jiangellaceae bacterium]